MPLKDKINDQLKTAMKSKDALTLGTLRMLSAQIKNEEIACQKRDRGLTDDEVIGIIAKGIKQRKDSIKQYVAGDRPDLAEKEQAELTILQSFSPAQMSEDDIRKMVEEVVDSGTTDFGAVMGQVMGKTKGKSDGNTVRRIVEEVLN